MFIAFFFTLRRKGLDVSLSEWMTLLEGLQKGLHHSTLSGFYYLCRSIVVKNEADFDKFDEAFLEFFKDAHFNGDLPDEFMKWVNHPSGDLKAVQAELRQLLLPEEDIRKILAEIEDRLRTQKSEHDGGHKWIGTHGHTAFGNAGWHPHGVRIGGESIYRTAQSVAGERKYRDFRKDQTLDDRNFQMAFKMLRNLSTQTDTSEKELDVDGTIQATADNAGTLKLCYRPPRRNTIKVLLLMDSGGSIEYYSSVCSALFSAAKKSRHFKELETYYFHNAIYDQVFLDPTMKFKTAVRVDDLLASHGAEWRVIIVGDAMMDPNELHGHFYDWHIRDFSAWSGMERFQAMLRKYPYIVWLNPEPRPQNPNSYWSRTYSELLEVFPMYPLTNEGLADAMKRLLVRS